LTLNNKILHSLVHKETDIKGVREPKKTNMLELYCNMHSTTISKNLALQIFQKKQVFRLLTKI
jgi:hypothetical protein